MHLTQKSRHWSQLHIRRPISTPTSCLPRTAPSTKYSGKSDQAGHSQKPTTRIQPLLPLCPQYSFPFRTRPIADTSSTSSTSTSSTSSSATSISTYFLSRPSANDIPYNVPGYFPEYVASTSCISMYFPVFSVILRISRFFAGACYLATVTPYEVPWGHYSRVLSGAPECEFTHTY